MFTPAPRPGGPRKRVELPEQKRGDGLERRPPAGTARRRRAAGETPYCGMAPVSARTSVAQMVQRTRPLAALLFSRRDASPRTLPAPGSLPGGRFRHRGIHPSRYGGIPLLVANVRPDGLPRCLSVEGPQTVPGWERCPGGCQPPETWPALSRSWELRFQSASGSWPPPEPRAAHRPSAAAVGPLPGRRATNPDTIFVPPGARRFTTAGSWPSLRTVCRRTGTASRRGTARSPGLCGRAPLWAALRRLCLAASGNRCESRVLLASFPSPEEAHPSTSSGGSSGSGRISPPDTAALRPPFPGVGPKRLSAPDSMPATIWMAEAAPR